VTKNSKTFSKVNFHFFNKNNISGTPNGEKIKALVLPLRKKFKDTFRFQRWPSTSVSDGSKSGAASSASSLTSLTSSFSLNEAALHNDVTFDM
jgi:hypothetical protein